MKLKYELYNCYLLLKFLMKGFFLRNRDLHNVTKNIDSVVTISYRDFAPNGGKGGGAAVQSCQKILLGDSLDHIHLDYYFSKDNKFSKNKKNNLWCLWASIDRVFKLLKHKKYYNSVFITHDYCTAAALAMLGRPYCLVYHLQGPRIEEKINFGEKFSVLTKKIIQIFEKKAFKYATFVCFPSDGAYSYYISSKYRSISSNQFTRGPTLYNTLYAYPEPVPLKEVKKDLGCLTFLSVGQLVLAKGIDRVPDFFDKLLKNYNGFIRYIYVGKGPLESIIHQKLEHLVSTYKNFRYVYIKECSYPQMQYLQTISDIYIMLHRISIFDLTTLEMMNKSKNCILSPIGGNLEFNKENNIFLYDDKIQSVVNWFDSGNLLKTSKLNKLVYDNYFSNQNFVNSYSGMIKKLIICE